MELINSFDFAVLELIRENLSCAFLDAFLWVMTTLGNGGFVWIATALALIISKKHRGAGIMLAAGLIVCLLCGNLLLKNLIARPRPFVQNPAAELIISLPSGYSFPSGHTFSSFISATILSLYRKKFALPLFPAAAVIGFSRLYFYVHFPTDVICGAALGIILGAAVYKLCRKHIPLCADNAEKIG